MSTVDSQLSTKIVLASTSPRRADILRQIGLQFSIRASGLDEEQFDQSASPADLVMSLALKKAQRVAFSVSSGLIIGADTIVVIDGKVLGKPSSPAEAEAMLSGLSGKEHSVFTGVALLEVPGNRSKTSFVETRVRFRSLETSEIVSYVATGEPLDKAGAYGIQGKGAVLVEKINGCYFNVVGLPVAELAAMLKDFGVSLW